MTVLSVPPDDPTRCGWCEADLRGEPIPGGAGKFYTRAVGERVPDVYDGTLYWSCPECGWRWHRWPVDDYRYGRAQPYIVGQPEPGVPRGARREPSGDTAAAVREWLAAQADVPYQPGALGPGEPYRWPAGLL